jgi:Brp/Blh family beta-carotene 15,15'-monooxygenase
MHHYLNLQSRIFLLIALITLLTDFLFASKVNAPNFLILILMIALFGVPHGSLDALFAQKAFELNTLMRWAKFVVIYLFLSILVVTFWLFFPTLFFILFLFFSALHFADDIAHIQPKIMSILYGLNIILLPSILQGSQLTNLYGYLIDDTNALMLLKMMKPLALLTAFITLTIFIIKKNQIETHHKIDIISVSLLMLLIHPLLAFTIYFCFMHSARHMIRSKRFFIDQSNHRFIFMLVLPTLAVLVFCMLMLANMPANQMDENLIKLTFVTLAALTLPHAYLLNKVGFIKLISR